MRNCVTFLPLLAFGTFASASTVHLDLNSGGASIDINIDNGAKSWRTVPSSQRLLPHETSTGRRFRQSSSRTLEDFEVDLGYEHHQGSLSESGKYVKFANVPYASPPVGDLRFTRPYAPEYTDKKNNGSRSAICPQYQVGWYPAAEEFTEDMLLNPTIPPKWTKKITVDDYEKLKPKQELNPLSSEDCLLLDVVVPKRVWDDRNKRSLFRPAVVIWIHGGGYIYGSKDDIGSPESFLSTVEGDEDSQGVIHVAINYRLGAFGFLGGNKFYQEGGMPNLGLWDQRAAIEWVANHIYYFGGDPNRLTVMGQSAGASSIIHHITAGAGISRPYVDLTPKFKTAIVHSPAFFPQPNATLDDDNYKTFLKLSNATDMDDLLEKNTTTLMWANANMTFNSSYGVFQFGPTIDGLFVPDLPGRLLKSGYFWKGISVLVGHQKFDGLVFTPPWIRDNTQLREHVKTLYPSVNDTVLAEIDDKYKIPSGNDPKPKILAVSDFLDDLAVQCNTYWLGDAMMAVEGPNRRPLYRYVFNIVPAIHGHDVPYTYYPNLKIKPMPNETIAKTWQSALLNFTQFIDPNPVQQEIWPEYTPDNRVVMNIGSANQFLLPINTYTPGNDTLDRKRCDYWVDAPYYNPPKEPKQTMIEQTHPDLR